MQRVFTVWDDGRERNGNAYRHVNDALERGASVVSVSTAAVAESFGAPPQHGAPSAAVALSVFVLEGNAEQLE